MQGVESTFREQALSAFEAPLTAEVWSRHCSRPALIMDFELRLLWCNPAGDRLLSTDRDLRRAGGRLQFKSGVMEQFTLFLRCVDGEAAAWALPRSNERGCIIMRVTKVALGVQDAFVVAFSETNKIQRIWARFGPALGLTDAEEAVLKRLVDGANVDTAAAAFGVSVETARTHVKRAYAKLGVSSREEMFAEILPFRLG